MRALPDIQLEGIKISPKIKLHLRQAVNDEWKKLVLLKMQKNIHSSSFTFTVPSKALAEPSDSSSGLSLAG